jgi:hypothetical protein
MILAYPLIRLSGGSEIFNLPELCALFAASAAAFVYWSFRAQAAATPAAATPAVPPDLRTDC